MVKQQHHLTQEWKDNLEAELEDLENVKLPAVLERLKSAIEQWDISENAEYDASIQDKEQVEVRIKEIKLFLKNSVLIDSTKKSNVVRYGSNVTIEDEDGNIEEYSIVGSGEVDIFANKISLESPLGSAIQNRKVWESITIEAPKWAYDIIIKKIA